MQLIKQNSRPRAVGLPLAILTFFGVGMIANMISLVAYISLIPALFLPQNNEKLVIWSEAHPWQENLNTILTFPATFFIILVYVWPVLAELKQLNSGQPISNKASRRLLNSSLVIALLGLCTWVLSPILREFIMSLYGWQYLPMMLVKNILLSIIVGLSTLVIIYYVTDYIVRARFIPLIVKNGLLSKIQGVMHLSVRGRFSIFLIAVSITPIVLLTLALYTADYRLLKVGERSHLTIFLSFSGAMMLASFFLTFLISRSFHNPLEAMRNAVASIQSGNLDISVPIVTTDELGVLGEGLNEMAAGLREKEFIKDTFGRAVDPRVRDHLLANGLNMGGEMRNATVLFSDIRSFTSISEKLDPDQIVDMLNRYFEKMSECIYWEKGIINKFIGDAIMAVFGAPISLEDHADSAVRAALFMREARDEINRHFAQEGLPVFHAGIGIHSDQILAGNIGMKSRLEYTVIGDGVNLASRIEKLCKRLSTDLLFSEETYRLLSSEMRAKARYLHRVRVKGKANIVKVYTI